MSVAFDIRPSELVACGCRIKGEADKLAGARRDLARILGAMGGVGGDSKEGRQFATAYDEPAGQMVTVIGSLAVAMESIGDALISMAATYEYVDEVMAADIDSIGPYGRKRPFPNPPAVPAPPHAPPKIYLPSIMREGEGGSGLVLGIVAEAWGRAANSIELVRMDAMSAMNTMLEENHGPALMFFMLAWQKWVAPDGYLDSVAGSAVEISKFVAKRAQAMIDENDFVGGFIGGLWDSTVGAVIGLGELAIKVIQNPTMLLDAAIELQKIQLTLLTRPDIVLGTAVQFAQSAPGAAAAMVDYASHMSPHQWGYVFGQATGIALTTVAGGELVDAANVAKASLLTKLGDVADASKLTKLADTLKLGKAADIGKATDVLDAERAGGAGARVTVHGDGTYSINDWTGYHEALPKPDPPFSLRTDADQILARKQADAANKVVRSDARAAGADNLKEMQVHEIKPVKHGGSPTGLDNKVLLPTEIHKEVTAWWGDIQRLVEAAR